MTYTCKCGDSYTEAIQATGHNMNASETKYSNYFQSSGTETVKCSNSGCNYSVARDIAKSLIYLTPNSNWKQSNARFAAYFFGNGEKWVSMTDFDGDGTYECEVPSGYPNVIFCRMNPSTTANNWNNKWNQTGDLTVPTDKSNNHYTVKTGTWDNGGGTWNKLEYTTIYFEPNDNWKTDNARFAVYTWHESNGSKFEMWANMTDVDGDGIYEANIREGYKFILCRMNPGTTANNWNNKWNQTGNLTIPTNGNNLFTLSSSAWDGSTSSWSKKS